MRRRWPAGACRSNKSATRCARVTAHGELSLVGLVSAYIEHFTYAGLFVILMLCGLGCRCPRTWRCWRAATWCIAGSRAIRSRWRWRCSEWSLATTRCFSSGGRFGTGLVRYFSSAGRAASIRSSASQAFMQRHGHRAIFYARFLAGLRALVYLSAGSFGVRPRRVFDLRSARRDDFGADRRHARIRVRQATRDAGPIYRRLRAADLDRGGAERRGVRNPDAGDAQDRHSRKPIRAGRQTRARNPIDWPRPRVPSGRPMSKMDIIFPALNLKAKLIVLMVGLLALTLGAEVWVSLGTQAAIVAEHAGEGQRSRARDSDQRAGADRGGRHRSRAPAQLRRRSAHAGARGIDRVEREPDHQQLESESDRRGAAAQAGRMADARATQASG